MVICQANNDNQWWSFYENGEIVNKGKGQCLDIRGKDAGVGSGVGLYPCESLYDQSWSTPDNLKEGDYLSFVSKKRANVCLDVKGYSGDGNTMVYYCEGLPDQHFRFDKEAWSTPTVYWEPIACN